MRVTATAGKPASLRARPPSPAHGGRRQSLREDQRPRGLATERVLLSADECEAIRELAAVLEQRSSRRWEGPAHLYSTPAPRSASQQRRSQRRQPRRPAATAREAARGRRQRPRSASAAPRSRRDEVGSAARRGVERRGALARWLEGLGALDGVAQRFAQAGIGTLETAAAAQLTEVQLRALGLAQMRTRKLVMQALERERRSWEPPADEVPRPRPSQPAAAVTTAAPEPPAQRRPSSARAPPPAAAAAAGAAADRQGPPPPLWARPCPQQTVRGPARVGGAGGGRRRRQPQPPPHKASWVRPAPVRRGQQRKPFDALSECTRQLLRRRGRPPHR
jgi:hypothetical protein